MTEDLYFIDSIVRALRGPDAREALRAAFRDIVCLGQRARFDLGYRQFQRWMEAVAAAHGALDNAGLSELAPRRRQTETVSLIIECDGRPVTRIELEGVGKAAYMKRARPGRYRVIFETGWVLLDTQLIPADFLWTESFPGEPLSMAADDDLVLRQPPTREFDLASGCLAMRIYAGREAGCIEFVRCSPGDADNG